MRILLFSAILVNVQSSRTNQEDHLAKSIVKECINSYSQTSCFANRVAKAVERAMDWSIPLTDGVQFARNKEKLSPEARSQPSGFARLMKALTDFLNTHTLTLDLTEEVKQARDGDGGFGGFDNKNKALKKEKKYMQYALMVLLGIFGLTGPLIMKTLAVMAAKALIASKMALIIVGSVALKKIFEKDKEETSIKVHTIHTDDEHDRISNQQYWSHQAFAKPA
ncbi:DUF1676 domain containing protein [Asbolus verrucosus]|uniref:DUF1676 domain containing protein n=1 Tax=Asbolus verrucosus TaxID=1661398 RepID=A0A482VWS7_ASBVE|nr:DUF1676 domain containing protein [Asbolus verrucosus]